MTTTPVLPSLPEPSAHMLPSDLTKFKTSETWSQAFSVAVVNPDERSEPLFTAEQMDSYARRAIESLSRAPARPTDDQLWDQTLRERDNYHEWADKLADSISRFIGLDIGEHSSANNPWARAIDMIPRGTLTEALTSRAPAEPVETEAWLIRMSDGTRFIHSHNAIADYRSLDPAAKVVELVPRGSGAHPPESAGPASADYSEQLTKAKNLLVRLWDCHPSTRPMIEGATGSWFAWGTNRDAALGESHEG